MKGTVYVYKTSPTTLESDIVKVLNTPDFQQFNPGKRTFIKINANYDRDWPGCNTSRWFLDGLLKNFKKKGFEEVREALGKGLRYYLVHVKCCSGEGKMCEKMKIAQVSHSYLPIIGGIQNYVYRLSRDLLNEGFHVEVLTTDMDFNKKDFNKKDRDFGSEVKYFHSYLAILGNPFPFGLILHLMKNEYDIIHVHSIQAIPSLISALLKKRAKFIVTPHGISPDDNRFLVRLVWNIYKPFSKFICTRADKVIVLGSKEKEKIIRLFDINESKIEVIPNGIELEEKPSSNTICNFKHRFGLENFHTVLFVGRVSPTKNPEILIKAFKIVHNEIKDTKLIFVGPISDSYRSNLITLARELNIDKFVVFTGEVNREDVLSAYCYADIFVSLGGWEGLPTTMLEAMSFGLPCIMFNSGGVGDVIKEGETGLIVNELDSEKIAEKIGALLEDHDLREEISRHAKKEILENYIWEYCFKKIYGIYETSVAEEFYE